MTATDQKNVKDVNTGIVKIVVGLSASGKMVQQDLENYPLDKMYVGLNEVDNTSDLDKPVSTATQNALNQKLSITDYTGASILSRLITVDGAGSGLDADLLDGQSSAYYTDIPARLGYTPVNSNLIGQNNGIATLDSSGKIPSANLPSYVDDVLEFATASAFPLPGETGKIYVDISTNLTYRWSGSVYVQLTNIDVTAVLDDMLALAVALG